jgi:hypothetical protein
LQKNELVRAAQQFHKNPKTLVHARPIHPSGPAFLASPVRKHDPIPCTKNDAAPFVQIIVANLQSAADTKPALALMRVFCHIFRKQSA